LESWLWLVRFLLLRNKMAKEWRIPYSSLPIDGAVAVGGESFMHWFRTGILCASCVRWGVKELQSWYTVVVLNLAGIVLH
jgi:hypothetical protein